LNNAYFCKQQKSVNLKLKLMKKANIFLAMAIASVIFASTAISQPVSEAFQETPSTTFYTSVNVSTDFETTVENVKAALKTQGFGVVSEINMQEKLKKGANKDIPKYVILGACNPEGAYKALQVEENIGVILPCNVIVRETKEGGVVVAAVNPLVTMKSTGKEDLKPLAEDIAGKLKNVINSLK
jgi:uncharacterized protein (DUF302 family)